MNTSRLPIVRINDYGDDVQQIGDINDAPQFGLVNIQLGYYHAGLMPLIFLINSFTRSKLF